MKTLAIVGCITALCTGGVSAASNVVPPAPAANGIIQVEGGCGPYGFRDYYGYCRPRRVFVARPRYYGCPFGFHPTPYGCRPNY